MKKVVLVFIVAISLISNINSQFRYRKLIDESTKAKTCSKASKSYKKPKDITTLTNFVESLGKENENTKSFIQGILLNGSMDNFTSLIKDFLIYIIIIGLGIIFLICKIIYIIFLHRLACPHLLLLLFLLYV